MTVAIEDLLTTLAKRLVQGIITEENKTVLEMAAQSLQEEATEFEQKKQQKTILITLAKEFVVNEIAPPELLPEFASILEDPLILDQYRGRFRQWLSERVS